MHTVLIQQAFTQQADAYAAAASIKDPARVARLVQLVAPAPGQRALDVATGPGYVAEALAAVCAQVVGVDVTRAPLALAEKRRAERGLGNLRFQQADAHRLPFAADVFDRVVCRYAFHHLPEPLRVLREMARVCAPGGRLAVEDLTASEHAERAADHNQVERLRDPSHTRALALSELVQLFAAAGLEVEAAATGTVAQDAEAWLAVTQTPPAQADQARQFLRRDAAEDLSGLRPFVDAAGRLGFTHRTAIVVGRKIPLPPGPGR